MSEWPEGWFRDEKPARAGAGGDLPAKPAGEAAPGVASEPTAQLPVGAAGAPSAGGAYASAPGQRGLAGAWPEQPPLYAASRTGQPAPPGTPRPPAARPQPGRGGRKRGRSRTRRVLLIVGIVVLVLLIVIGALYFYLDSQLNRRNVLVDYSGRPAVGAGQNWLITGSDSRRGLTRAQKRQLHTGLGISGHRSDTILVLHIPSSGPATLISIPRDSFVQIPGYGGNKINAAFAFGGPKLLAKTVQNATGLRIEHYMEIGFGGLVNVVNAVGGVRMCLAGPIKDPASGLNLKAGCQNLNGEEALGYVRTRHDFSNQDLQRVQNQRIFLRALLSKLTSPGTLLNPFASVPAAFGASNALTVDSGTHLYQLLQVALALRNPQTTTVPIANANYASSAGDAVLWDSARANQLFRDLNHDRTVPKDLLSGSHQSAQ
ncbi:MAG TPA: LCP family protein [Streptosporangiaceae bacterium]|nr:LCP family protein [Streptosporangiaceae bacterium]